MRSSQFGWGATEQIVSTPVHLLEQMKEAAASK